MRTSSLNQILFNRNNGLDLNFADSNYSFNNSYSKNLNRIPGWTFSRTGNATAHDLEGNVIQFPARTNLVRWSRDPSNGLWSKIAGGSVTGTNTINLTTESQSRVEQSFNANTGDTVTCSAVLSGSGQIRFGVVDNGGSFLNTYVVVTLTATPTRYSVTRTIGGSGLTQGIIRFITNNNEAVSFTADEAQAELGTVATPYILTTSSVVTIASPRITNRGILIEEARTNLLPYSNAFSTADWVKGGATILDNVALAPDRTMTAAYIAETAITGSHRIYESLSKAANALTYTFSFYVKAAGRTKIRLNLGNSNESANASCPFDLVAGTAGIAGGTGMTGISAAIQVLANGWHRCSVTATTDTDTFVSAHIRLADDTGATGHTGDVTKGAYIWGAQLELGAFATSLIPSAGGPVARGADLASVASVVLAPTFTWVSEGYAPPLQPGLFPTMVGSTGSNVGLFLTGSINRPGANMGNSTFNSNYGPNIAVGALFKQSFRSEANNAVGASNGILGTVDISFTPAIGTQTVNIGVDYIGANPWNSYITRICILPYGASNTELQALTRTTSVVSGIDLDFVKGAYAFNSPYSSNPSNIPGWSFSRLGTSTGTALNNVGSVINFGTRTNLFLRSQEFSDATWAKNNTTVSTGATAPDGSSSSRLTASGAFSQTRQSLISMSTGSAFTVSIYAKFVNETFFTIVLEGVDHNSNYLSTTYNFSTNTFSTGSSGFTGIATIATAVGNDWFRLQLTAVIPAGVTQVRPKFWIGQYSGTNYSGQSVDVWAAQLETGSVATDYIPTTTAAVTTGVPRITDKGLLIEESRTNLALRSQALATSPWQTTGTAGVATNNVIGAPDGTTTATQLTVPGGGPNGYAQVATLTAATYTISAWVRSVSSTQLFRFNYYNGTFSQVSPDFTATTTWQFFSYQVTGAAAAGNIALIAASTNAAFDVYVWGVQLELGAFSTSYIPTTSAAVTRGADTSLITSLTSFGYPVTLFAEWTRERGTDASTFYTAAALEPNNFDDRSEIFQRHTTNVVRTAQRSSGGVLQGDVTLGDGTIGNIQRAAVRFATNDIAGSHNGGVVATDTSATMPADVVRLCIGSRVNSTASFIGGYIRRIRVLPYAASNTELQELTRFTTISGVDLNFARNEYAFNSPYRSSPPSISGWSFSRSNAGTALDLAGNVVQFATDVPRITDLGLLIEETRTNSIANSISVSSSTGVTVTNLIIGAPDNTATAIRLTKTDDTTPRYSGNPTSMTVAALTTYTLSRFFKYNGFDTTVSLETNSTLNWGLTSNANARFNVTSSGITAGATTNCTSTVTAFANGWFRCTATFTSGASPTTPTDPSVLTQITGATGVSVLCWGYQIETGTFATSPIITTGSAITRGGDTPSLGTSILPIEGTIILTYVVPPTAIGTAGRIYGWNVQDSTNSRLTLRIGDTPTPTSPVFVVGDGSVLTQITGASLTPGTTAKVAVSYSFITASCAMTVNGTDQANSRVVANSLLTTAFRIGSTGVPGTNTPYSPISRIQIIPRFFSSTERIAATL